jgi:hypothetical protein
MIRILAAAAILAAPTAAQAQQQCITPQQVGDAAVVAAPILIDSVAAACKAHLPAAAFLNSGAAGFSGRLRSEGASRVDSALSVLRLVGGDELGQMQDKAAVLAVIGGLAQIAISQGIPQESCAGLSGMVEALAPLPAENIALLARSTAIAMAAAQEKASKTAAEAAKKGKSKAGGVAEADVDAGASAPKICPNG